jgi:AcrR family transcriptional regulator
MKIPDTPRRRGRPAFFDREAGIGAAVSLFWRHGYDGTSIAMLTDAMGMTAPALYSAFGSKEALCCEALSRYQQQEAVANGSVLAESPTVYRMVEGFLRASATRFAAGRGCMIATGAINAARMDRRPPMRRAPHGLMRLSDSSRCSTRQRRMVRCRPIPTARPWRVSIRPSLRAWRFSRPMVPIPPTQCSGGCCPRSVACGKARSGLNAVVSGPSRGEFARTAAAGRALKISSAGHPGRDAQKLPSEPRKATWRTGHLTPSRDSAGDPADDRRCASVFAAGSPGCLPTVLRST